MLETKEKVYTVWIFAPLNIGEKHHHAKLTNAQAVSIFNSRENKSLLSRKYNVSRFTITALSQTMISFNNGQPIKTQLSRNVLVLMLFTSVERGLSARL